MRHQLLGQRIALGNSDNGYVEGYATVQEVIKIPYSGSVKSPFGLGFM